MAMKKQLTVIGIIVILIAISISGCFENNKEGNESITPLSGKVTVTTNKSEYGQNETITITLYNGLNISVYSHAASISTTFCIESIEKKRSDEWESFFAVGQWPECDYDIDVPAEIKSGESVSFDWEPLIWISGCNNFTRAEPGVYRLVISYQIREGNLSENWAWQLVYSNEFTIKEQRELLSSHILIYGESYIGPLYTKEVNITIGENGYFMTYTCENSSDLTQCDCKKVEKNINETIIESYLNYVNTLVDEGEGAKCCDHPWTEMKIIYKDGSEKSFILPNQIDIETIFGINC